MPRCPRKIEVPRAAIHAFGLSLLAACSEGASPISSGGSDRDAVVCDLGLSFLVVGAAIDVIPSIDDPNLVSAKDEIPSYRDSDTRVIGFQIDGVAYAIPHNVLWFHEIVNLEVGGESLAVTYCPLTGSSLAFARGRVDNVTFGVSGLLYQNNLVLYDRNDPSSRWSQIFAEARCGPRSGTPLPQWPVVEMKWDAWVEASSGDSRALRGPGLWVRLAAEQLSLRILRRPIRHSLLDPTGDAGPRPPAADQGAGVGSAAQLWLHSGYGG